VREAAEVDDVIESLAAGCEALVAARRHHERIATGDNFRHRLPQFYRDNTMMLLGDVQKMTENLVEAM
jgi:NAD/NADP transhydrogenase beta subunit